jgi:hypothetical protein
MNRRLLACALAPLALLVGLEASAAPPAKKGPVPAAKEPVTVGSLATMLDGFRWAMTPDDVVKMHNQVQGVFDRDYNPRLMHLQPGVQMKAVEAQRENKKITFQRSLITFDNTPVGYDTTGLSGEYSYRNHESAQTVERDGKRRFFFYIGALPGARLWKIYDEVQVGGALGNTFQEAVQKITARLGAAGTPLKEDAARGLPLPSIAWQDATTQLRLVDRTSEHVIGLVVEDKSILHALPQLRSSKPEDPLALDPAIAAVTSGGVSDPSGHRAAADAGAPKKKK